MINGIVNLDKPSKISSARAVGQVKRLLPRGTKIGHAGTLDPFATGVLLLLIGKATKQCERLMDAAKQYEATIKFGATTATDDPESPETPLGPAHGPGYVGHLTLADVKAVLPRFVGAIQQTPPAFSAMKIDGRRAYKLARDGQDVKLQPRTVQVYGLEIINFASPLLRLKIDCGRGTYIRAIARDLGIALKVGGYLTELRRTQIGRFHARDAASIEQIAEGGISPHLQTLEPLD